MKNASKFVVDNRSELKVELTLSWSAGAEGQKKVTLPYSQNIDLFQLDDNTKVTVEGKIGSNPTFLTFNYKHNAGTFRIEVYADGSYTID